MGQLGKHLLSVSCNLRARSWCLLVGVDLCVVPRQTASVILQASDYSTVFPGNYLATLYSSNASAVSAVSIAATGGVAAR
jgi:hypothetical protein